MISTGVRCLLVVNSRSRSGLVLGDAAEGLLAARGGDVNRLDSSSPDELSAWIEDQASEARFVMAAGRDDPRFEP